MTTLDQRSKNCPSGWTLAFAVLCTFGTVGTARADVLVAATNSENTLPLIVQGRYQQTYGGAAFATLGAGDLITGIAFALDPTHGTPFSGTIADLEIRLSTVPILPSKVTGLLSLGSDARLVHDGSVFLSGTKNGTAAIYDIVVPFSQPFRYDPAAGSLLVDIFKRSPERLRYGYLEVGSNPQVARSWYWDGGISAGTNAGYGASTLFLTSPVPEGGTAGLFVLGLFAMACRLLRAPAAGFSV